MLLYHVSDRCGIAMFEPRAGGHGRKDEAVVWAIDADHLPNYLLPRDCPRVTFCADDNSDPADIERLMCGADARRVIAVESKWLPVIQEDRLYVYEFDSEGFVPEDEIAGYYISCNPVVPVSETKIGDILGELIRHDVELRIMPSLWKLRETVIHSTLPFSIIRMRNAEPPAEGYEAYHPL